MKKQEIIKTIEHLKQLIESMGDSLDSDCMCKVTDDKPMALVASSGQRSGPGSDGPPIVYLIHSLKEAFPIPGLQSPKEFEQQLGTTLMLCSEAFTKFVDDLSIVGADEGGWIEDMSKQISEKIVKAVKQFSTFGSALLTDEVQDIPDNLYESAAEILRKVFDGLVDHLYRLGAQEEDGDIFFIHANNIGAIGTAIIELISIIPKTRPFEIIDEVVLGAFIDCRHSIDNAILIEQAVMLMSNLSVTELASECPEDNPFLACTIYCTDNYRTRISCTPKWWQRVIGGVGGPSGLYHIVCRWHVTRKKKYVCVCYPSRWKRFWAQGGCTKWVFTKTSNWIDSGYNHYKISLKVPSALPGPFSISCGVDRITN